jgi:hypothetical protein
MSLTPHRSSLILLAHLPIPGFNTVVLARYLAFQPSAALILATVYQAYYIALEPIGGVSLSPSILPTRARCNSPQLYSPFSRFKPAALPSADGPISSPTCLGHLSCISLRPTSGLSPRHGSHTATLLALATPPPLFHSG